MSGQKRSLYGSTDRARESDRKPKDWRDAFLDEPATRRERSRSRDRDGRRRDDDGRGDRSRGGLDYDDRRGNEGRGDARGQYSHGSNRQYPTREHRGGAERGYERESDRRRHNQSTSNMRGNDREEGEIESPAAPKAIPTVAAKVARPTVISTPPLRGFRGVNVPTQPRSVPPPPPSGTNALESNGRETKRARVEDVVEEIIEPVVVLEEERDPEKVLEERRRKREEIMAKFRANGGNTAVPTIVEGKDAAGTGADTATSTGIKTGMRTGLSTSGATPLLKALGTRSTMAPTPTATTPALREPTLASTPLGNDFDLAKQNSPAPPSSNTDLISAADYDPRAEGEVDQARRDRDTEIGEQAKLVAGGIREPIVVPDDEWEEVEMEVDDEDEEVDMFDAFEESDRPKKKRKIKVKRKKQADGSEPAIMEVLPQKPKVTVAVVDNVDDAEGYYRITPGEIVDDGRYQVTTTLGKGMFSAVVKAKVLKAVGQERRQDVVGKEVAIKVIRSQESMYVAGRKEAQILKRLNEADAEDKKHIVRMEHTFEHHGHLCIVTESLSMNLRDVLKRFGKDVGLNMRAVRAYAHQLFLSLSLMRKCSIVHADIKPDNILVSENKATLKVCDFGSASDVADGDITPYLVSRFYRAPEIILGLPFDTAIDIWSIGCTLYELYTGKILFPGRSNNRMLLLMMEVKGKINHRLIKKASFGEMYFDEGMNFLSVEKDKITGSDVLKTLVISGPSRDIRSRILPSSNIQLKMKDDEIKQLTNFVDLLDKCLQLDPAKRITPRDALLHPFVAGTT